MPLMTVSLTNRILGEGTDSLYVEEISYGGWTSYEGNRHHSYGGDGQCIQGGYSYYMGK